MITHAPGESPDMIMIAVNERGAIFLSTQNSSLSMDELPEEIDSILGDGGSYSFVIQSEVNDGSYAKEIEEMLHSKGVKKRHVAVSRSVP